MITAIGFGSAYAGYNQASAAAQPRMAGQARFGSSGIPISDALELIKKGNPQQAILGLVERLKKTASASHVDLYEVQKIHAVLAKAFLHVNIPKTDENIWKYMMHSGEAVRLARLIGRPDLLRSQGLEDVRTTAELSKQFTRQEMVDWFRREGLEYRA